MSISRRTLRCAAVAASLIPALASAQGQIQFLDPLSGTTGGLGTVLTVLTLNNTNNVSTGCITPSGPGSTAVGSCGYLNNTLQASSTTRLLAEIGGSTSTLGTDLRIIANFSEPQQDNDGAVVQDLSLYLYNQAGAIVYTAVLLPTEVTFANTNPGVGNIGFTFGLTPASATSFQTALNAALGAGGTVNNLSIGLGASLSGVQGGLDTFSLVRVTSPSTVVPEPSTYALMASGLLAMGVVARRRRTA